MAYTYDENQQASNTNIFGGGPQNEEEENQNANAFASANNVKSSTEGQVQSSGQSSASEGVKPVQDSGQDSQSQRLEAIRRGAERQQAPEQFGQISSQLKDAKVKLQSEADDYMRSQQARAPSFNQEQVSSAVQGDQQAFGDVSGALQGQRMQAESFRPETRVNVSGGNLLNSLEGSSELLRRQARGNYSQGESAFDRMLMGRNPELQAERRQLASEQEALLNSANQMRTDLTGQAQQTLDQGVEQNQEAIRNYLASLRGGLNEQQEAEMAAERERLQGLDLASIGNEALTDVRSSLAQDYAEDPFMQRFINEQSLTPEEFVQLRDLEGLNASQFIDENEAAQFNAISSLLGEGGPITAAAQQAPDYTIDRQELQRSLVDNATTQANTRMQEITDQIAAIKQAGLARTAENNRLALSGDQGYAQEQINSLIQELQDQYQGISAQGVDTSQFFTGTTGASGAQLTPEEIQQINALREEAFMPGQFSNDFTSGVARSFDRDAARRAIIDQYLKPRAQPSANTLAIGSEAQVLPTSIGGNVNELIVSPMSNIPNANPNTLAIGGWVPER